jgi:GT2 family glycosyltransferase
MISAIVVNYHSARLTERAVKSILQEGEEVEVFVVDNTATEEEKSLLRNLLNLNVNLVFNETNKGFARACNMAYASSKGEWILLLNPDAYLLPGALEALKAFLIKNPKAGAVGPKIYWDNEKNFLLPPSAFPSAVNEFIGQTGRISRAFRVSYTILQRRRYLKAWKAFFPLKQAALSGGHIMLRRSAIENCGGLFDDNFFMYYEDSDLIHRLKKAGYDLYMEPRAQVVHNYIHEENKMEMMEKSRTIYFNNYYRNSILLKIAEKLSVMRKIPLQRNFTYIGSSKSPVKVNIPKSFQDNWLFEWSPTPELIPSVGSFGSGPEMDYLKMSWEMLGPGTYYARISSPRSFVSSSIYISWDKE